MPRYTFSCEICGTTFDTFLTIANRNNPQTCECGGTAKRNAAAEIQGCSDFNAMNQDHPRWSIAMGCNPEEIPERMKLYPDREYHPETGDLLVKNRAHKLKLMKEFGYVERR